LALLSVRFALPRREFRVELALELDGVVALVGPSGAGKSTVLSVIAGIVRPPSGRITLDGEIWLDSERRVNLAPDRRRVGMVFQEYALFPHMTVRQNIAYGGRDRVDELLERFGIERLAAARPAALSGGERQRVALARALARDPGVLLLDEPLASLDSRTRVAVRSELRELLAALDLPTLVVTHDFDDAVALAGRVGVLVDGRLRQLGSTDELLTRPADSFVASFTGANVLRGRALAGPGPLTEVLLETGETIRSTDAAQGAVDVVIHPWEISLWRSGAAPDANLEARQTASGATVAATRTGAMNAAPDNGTNQLSAPVTALTRAGGRVRVAVGPLTVELTVAAAADLALAPGMIARATFTPVQTRLIARG
jgi:molybdate transport system ATP-binding protein